jgi:putative copper export protein
MDNLATYVGNYWWVIVVPAALMLFIWLFQGPSLRWVVLVGIAGVFFFTFSGASSSGVRGALHQVVDYIVDIIRRIGTSLL